MFYAEGCCSLVYTFCQSCCARLHVFWYVQLLSIVSILSPWNNKVQIPNHMYIQLQCTYLSYKHKNTKKYLIMLTDRSNIGQVQNLDFRLWTGLCTSWTMHWIMDWILDSILDLILDWTAECMNLTRLPSFQFLIGFSLVPKFNIPVRFTAYQYCSS